MKKILMAIILAMALILSVSIVSAAVTVESSFSSSSPTFGSDSQMASNPNADDEADENIYDTGEVTLNSTAAVTVTGITVSPASGFTTDDLNITLDDTDLALAAGVSEPVTLKARIPEELDAVNSDLEEVAFKVGTATLTFSDSSTVSFDVYMQRQNMLVIDKLYVSVDGNRDNYEDGDRVDDEAKPGDDIEIELKAENTYDEDDDDVQIEDVEFIVEVDDLDVDEDYDLGDIDPDSTESGTVSFSIESDADEDTYDMIVYLEGEDEHGARMGEKAELEFKVEKKSHDIVIKSANLLEDSVSCTRGSNSISVKIENIGSSDEDEVALYVENKDLGIDYKATDLEIDEGDDYSRTVSFTVSDSLKAGTYPVRVSAYYSGDKDDGVLADLVEANLVVSACATAAPEPEVITPAQPIEVPSEVLEEFGITETEESTSFTSSGWFIGLLIAFVALAFVGVILLIVLLVKGKEEI